MPNDDDTFLNSHFAAYRDELIADVTPAGTDAVRMTVRRRRRVAVTAGTALAIALIAGPVAGYTALSRGPAPPPPGTTPAPTPSASTSPSASPSPSASATTPAGPDGRITKADLLKAKLTLPAWQSDAPSGCVTKDVRLDTEARTGRPGLMSLTYGDADGDGTQETIAILGCRPGEAAMQQVVVFDRDAAGKIYTLGQVVRTGIGFDWIITLKIDKPGSVQVQIGDIQPCCDTPASAARKQWRTYTWNGDKFRQSGGPTVFPDKPLTDLRVTATDVVFGADGKASIKVTVRNAGPVDAENVFVWLEMGDSDVDLDGAGWSACKESSLNKEHPPITLECLVGPMRAGETKTLTLGMKKTGTTATASGTARVMRLDINRDPSGDLKESDNGDAFKVTF